MISIGNDLIIYNAWDEAKFSLGISESFVHTKELMKQNSISIDFNLHIPFDFVRGDYIEYEGEKYTLRKNYEPKQVNSQEYNYELVFEGVDMQFQDFIMFYTYQSLRESEFTLTDSAYNFMLIALDNIKKYFNDDSFTLGNIADTNIENISFDGSSVFDALTTIAETFECEWYLDGKTLNLVSKYEHGDLVVLEEEVSISSISKANEGADLFCTRLFAFGSTRNIPKNYRSTQNSEVVDAIVQKRLRLPISTGDYIDAIPNMKPIQVVEKVVHFDEIYPKRIGTIKDIRSVDRTEDKENPFIVYFFKDSDLKFKLDYIIEGETLMITFESGFLQGRDFGLAYNEKTEEFEIINDTSNSEMTIPNEVLKPRVGDQYVIYNFDIQLVSDQYIPEAEEELYEKAKSYLKEITEDNATYTCINVPSYCYQNKIDLSIGQKVELVSNVFMDGSKKSRLYGFTKSLYNKYICTYLIGDDSKYSRLANIEKKVNDTKTLAEIQYKENSKNLKALSYLKTAMANETVIDKGMILTTLLRLGANSGNEWKENAGVSGIFDNPNDVAFWAGGTLDQAINLAEDPNREDDVASFVVLMDGTVIMNRGIVRGDITANTGQIGGFKIQGDSLTNEGFNNDASVIFRNDANKTFAGIGGNVLPLSSIIVGVARFENYNDSYDTSSYLFSHNCGIIVGAKGARKNTAITMTAGSISGLALSNKRIDYNYQIEHGDVYISCYNDAKEIELTLPFEPEEGKILYIRQMNSYAVKIIAKETDDIGNTEEEKTEGYYIHADGTKNKEITINSRGQLTMLFFDGQFWLFNKTVW